MIRQQRFERRATKQHEQRNPLSQSATTRKIELLPGTPNMFRNIQCPTCKTEMARCHRN
jgi:hypothetical protein